MKQKQINQNWKEFKLSEIGKVVTGGTPPRSEKGNYSEDGTPWIKPPNLDKEKWISKSEEYLSKDGQSKSRMLPKGSVIVSCIGNIGKIAIANCELSTNQQINSIIPNKNVDSEFLFYSIKKIQKRLENLASNAVVPLLNKTGFSRVKIPLPILKDGTPDLEKQKQIVAILEKAEGLKDRREGLDELFDEYLNSVFYEMFLKEKFEKETIRDLLEEAKYGSSKKANEEGRGYEMIRMNNITYAGGWDFKKMKYIELENEEEDKYLVRKGDILFNRTNSKELVGKTAVYRFDKPRAYAGYLVRLRTNERANPEYISGFLNSKYGKAVLFGMCKSIVGMANINAQEVQNIKLPVPPIELQEKFASIVEQVEKIKDKLKDEKKDADELFNALMQKAFSGELI